MSTDTEKEDIRSKKVDVSKRVILFAYYPAGRVFLPVQCDEEGRLKGVE